MPKFRNVTDKTKDIIHRGRKIRIEPNGTIDGPIQFKAFKELVQISEDEVKDQPPKKTINVDKSNIVNFNSNKKREKPLNRKAVIPNQGFTGMIGIPNNPSVLSEAHNNGTEVQRARLFVERYRKNGLPTVGIAILTKNSLELISDCVNSIENKVAYENTKIYIFDTGTTDNSVKKFYDAKKKNCKFPFEVINVGEYQFSRNYNDGVKHVDTDYIMIQNNDTLAVNDYISKLMKVAILDKVGLSGPRMLLRNGNIQHDGQFLYDQTQTKFINPGHTNMNRPNNIPGGRHIVDGITAAGVLVETSWFRDIEGFDEGFKDIYQDVHLCMKNKMFGKISICHRDSVIYHYDNTSRKDLWNNKNKVLDMARDHNFLFSKIKAGNIKLHRRNVKDFSIITVCNNQRQYEKLLDSLDNLHTSKSFEVICVPNFNGEYSSCAEALNVGKDAAEGIYHIYCHQDIHFGKDWLERIDQHIKSLADNKIAWGVLGIAGAAKGQFDAGYGLSYLSNKNENDGNFYQQSRKIYGDRKEVDCLDELCLITKAAYNLRFDEKTFNHWHWYGADFCLQAKQKGLKNYAIDATCVHESDGLSNLKDDANRKVFIDQAAKLIVKWKDTQPFFRTMTAWFDCKKGIAGFFLHDAFKKIGIVFPQGVKIKVNEESK